MNAITSPLTYPSSSFDEQSDAIDDAKQRRYRLIDNLLVKTLDQQLKGHPDLRDDLMHLIDRFVCRELGIAEPDEDEDDMEMLSALVEKDRHQQPGTYLFHPRLAHITGDRRHAS